MTGRSVGLCWLVVISLGVSLWFFFDAPGRIRNQFEKPFSADDLLTILQINALKLRFKSSGEGCMLDYWVESIKADGSRFNYDNMTLGLGKNDADILIRLPNWGGAEFGVFTEVNSSWGKSKLESDSEGLGSEEWLFLNDKRISTGQKIIVAIRIFGGDYNEGETLNESLNNVIIGKYNRVDVFWIRVRAAARPDPTN